MAKKNTEEKMSFNQIISLIIFIILFVFVIGLVGYSILEKFPIKMVNATLENLHYKIPNNYEKKSGLFSDSYSNWKCTVSVEKDTRMEFYNPNTQQIDDKSYNADELYDGSVELISKTINGKQWYYHEEKSDYFKNIYRYDYIEKNVRYTVTIYSKSNWFCRVDDIADSLMIY